jgi:NitT/TauT family transport system ATP-binding protein
LISSNALVHVQQISKSFSHANQREQVLENISLQIHQGEILTILGQSGCGKSTLLNIIGGFTHEDEGQVLIGDVRVQRPGRRCIMLFQHYGLLPWRSVLKNVELGLEELHLSAEQRKQRAIEYLTIVGLEDKLHLFPRHLSGGMQQRVAIARALATKPELLLMDEPFAALDTFNRYYLQDELLRIQQKEKTTMVLVTHDIDEAIYLSDRILIMSANPGRIHKELHIDISKPRDRSHGDFQYFRKIIFDHFHFNKTAESADYTI